MRFMNLCAFKNLPSVHSRHLVKYKPLLGPSTLLATGVNKVSASEDVSRSVSRQCRKTGATELELRNVGEGRGTLSEDLVLKLKPE